MYNIYIYVEEFENCMTQKTDNIYVIFIFIYTMCIGNNIDILCCTYNICYFS